MKDFCAFKFALLRRKLLNPTSTEASKMNIRPHLENLEDKLIALVRQTILQGDNTSVIIYGPKGSGKTLLEERAIRTLEEEFNKQNKIPILCTVRLSGILEKNQRDGFKSIVRQICKFTELEFQTQASAQENIEFFKRILIKLKEANRTCLIVLEEFEHFVRNSEKQEILYTVLDALQSKYIRCCVVGFTSDAKVKMDFNKRVVSRFSHKVWSISKMIDPYETIHSMLSVPSSKNFKSQSSKYEKSLKEALLHKDIQDTFSNESFCFSASDLRDIALLAASYSRDSATISSFDILDALDECLKRLEPMIQKIASLSVPQLYALISCFILKSNFTYKTAFGKYSCFIQMQNTSEIFQESMMIHAFEDLFNEGLIVHTKALKLTLLSPLDHFNLNCTKDEIWKGLNKNPMTSTTLHAFFKSA